MTRATWDLKVRGDSLGAVDNSRHWNFSIWSIIKGVMAILVKGVQICELLDPFGEILIKCIFYETFQLHPFTKMVITPLIIDQIEKFQCLESSTAPKLSPHTFRSHVARVLKLVNLFCE